MATPNETEEATLAKRASRTSTASESGADQQHFGIPRTHRAAKRLGYEQADIKFADLPATHKANFALLTEAGARSGALCGIGPSTDDGYWLVCYKQDGKQCTWVHVPKGQPVQDHG